MVCTKFILQKFCAEMYVSNIEENIGIHIFIGKATSYGQKKWYWKMMYWESLVFCNVAIRYRECVSHCIVVHTSTQKFAEFLVVGKMCFLIFEGCHNGSGMIDDGPMSWNDKTSRRRERERDFFWLLHFSSKILVQFLHSQFLVLILGLFDSFIFFLSYL